MKQSKFSKVLKSKGFYLSLVTGVLAIVTVCFVVFNTLNNDGKSNNNITNLNDNKSGQVADNTKKNDSTTTNKTGEDSTKVTNGNSTSDKDGLLENDIVTKPSNDTVDAKPSTNKDTSKTDDKDSVTTNSSSKKLTFTQETDLLWPVKNNIIIDYDVEHGVRFETLGQYKTNDAIVISAKVGTEVKAAARCKIVSIKENEETGTTITTDIGSGYSIIYGQLDDLKVKKGDIVNAGEVIGKIAKPTKYFVVEGPNLYFKVMEDDQSINPLLLLE